MEIGRRKLLALTAVGLTSTSWGTNLRLEWVPTVDSINVDSHQYGYGSLSMTGETPSRVDSLSVNNTLLSKPTNGVEPTIRLKSDPDTAVEPGTESSFEIEASSASDSETEVSDVGTADGTATGSSSSSSSWQDRDSENSSDPKSESAPKTGYGVDPYGNPRE